MIERDESVGAMTLRCDECGDFPGGDFNLDDFTGMIENAKQSGWSIKPDGEGGWEHRCPSCAPSTSQARLKKAEAMFGRRAPKRRQR